MSGVELFGLVCPQCGADQEPARLTSLRVHVDLDGILRFEAEGLARHRCEA